MQIKQVIVNPELRHWSTRLHEGPTLVDFEQKFISSSDDCMCMRLVPSATYTHHSIVDNIG